MKRLIFGLLALSLPTASCFHCSNNRELRTRRTPTQILSTNLRRTATTNYFSRTISNGTFLGKLRSQTVLQASTFKNFEEMLSTYTGKLVLVAFYATWCGPCMLMKKELESVREILGKDIKIFIVDTERWPHLGARYKVQGLPTTVLFKDGEVLERIEGFERADNLVSSIKAHSQ